MGVWGVPLGGFSPGSPTVRRQEIGQLVLTLSSGVTGWLSFYLTHDSFLHQQPLDVGAIDPLAVLTSHGTGRNS